MKHVINIILFLLAVGIGFFAAPLLFNFASISGAFANALELSNTAEFQKQFFAGSMITWTVCTVIGIGFFIAKTKLRWAFLLAPIVLPTLYGFKVLNDFSSLL